MKSASPENGRGMAGEWRGNGGGMPVEMPVEMRVK
jgi:hypothetical protein